MVTVLDNIEWLFVDNIRLSILVVNMSLSLSSLSSLLWSFRMDLKLEKLHILLSMMNAKCRNFV